MELDIAAVLNSLGAAKDAIHLLHEPTYSAINHLDLITGKSRQNQLSIDAIVEFQGQPLLYAISSKKLSKDPEIQNVQIRKLCQTLACQKSGTYLALVDRQLVHVFPNSIPANKYD